MNVTAVSSSGDTALRANVSGLSDAAVHDNDDNDDNAVDGDWCDGAAATMMMMII
jgi:hypothetical protein